MEKSVFFLKQKTAYERRISDWSSDVCSSDLVSLATIESEKTLLQHSIGRLVRLFGLGALLVSTTMVLGYGLLRGDWVQGVLSGIALAMSLLPEEFPMALAVFLALGAWRLAAVKVLARRAAMVETLGQIGSAHV